MCDPRRRISPPAIDQPFVSNLFVALEQAAEELLQFGILFEQRIEVARLPDHDFAANDGLDSVMSRAVAREDAFAGEAQRHDLAPSRCIGLELGEDSGPNEHDFAARGARLAERPPGLDLDDAVRDGVEQVCEAQLKTRRDQSLTE